ncbi:hypothetical protein V8C35DRAFT_302162 [Trichoderma chlorosporum]
MDAPATKGLTTPKRPASTESLPPEILLQIVTQLPGLDTLWNLMRASPQTWRLFDRYALLITESLLSGPNAVLSSRIQELVRGVILVRSGILPFRDLEDFQWRFVNSQYNFYRTPGYFTFLKPELLAASVVPAAALRSVVATAYHLSALAQACLESCLVRIRDPSFRPMHAYDPPPDYRGPYVHNGQQVHGVKPEDRVFVGTPVHVIDAGDPSWAEEMKALRAMWIIQLTGEVQCLLQDSVGTTEWSEEDVSKLNSMDAADVVGRRGSSPFEEVNTALVYVKTLGDTVKSGYFRLPRAPSAVISVRRTVISPKPSEGTPVVYGFRRNNEIHPLTRGAPVPKDGEPVANPPSKWGQTENCLLHQNPGHRAFRELTAGRVRMISPLEGVKFDSFRPLGLAFWDRWRLYLLGLTGGGSKEWTVNGERYLPYFYHFALESILPPEEVASVKAALRAKRKLDSVSNSFGSVSTLFGSVSTPFGSVPTS